MPLIDFGCDIVNGPVVLKYEMGNFGEMGRNARSLGEMGINKSSVRNCSSSGFLLGLSE